MSKWLRWQSPWAWVGGWFLISRVWLSSLALAFQHSQSEVSFSPWRWLDAWGAWDSVWFVSIAEYGYQSHLISFGNPAGTVYTYVFSPLYPLLMHLFSWLTGGIVSTYLAGVLVSNLALVLAAYVFYRYLSQLKDEAIARRAVVWLMLFPLSFFFSSVLTESVFLLLSILMFYLALRRQWIWLGVVGLLLGLSRVTAFFLIIPMIIEVVQARRKADPSSWIQWLGPVGIVLGLALHQGVVYYVTGDWMAFWSAQRDLWHHQLQTPWAALGGYVASYAQFHGRAWLELPLLSLVISLLVALRHRIPLSWIAYVGGLLLFFLTDSSWLSMGRYLSALFPLYAMLGMVMPGNRISKVWWLGSALLLGVFFIAWMDWQMV